MKALQFIIIPCFVVFSISCSTTPQKEINIIPKPASVVQKKGNFKLSPGTQIIADKQIRAEADYLASMLEKGFKQKPSIVEQGEGIILKLNPTLKDKLGNEGYLLNSGQKSITIEATTSSGIFYGIQTLRQMLPVNFEFEQQNDKTVLVPKVEITDTPRFPWRAFMLDEARHFKGVEEVKKVLDQMALLKMNTFHWHLTDDQGWRIEIKKYPKLTEIGAYRKDTQTSRHAPGRTGVPHEGHYTQEQIKEVIQYASERHIQIVPEIEMPGHATAAIASYPWLSAIGVPVEVPDSFGKFGDSYNLADPKVIQFLRDVLTEVIEIFPGKVIHIGGDEIDFEAWKKSKMIRDFIAKEGMKTPADLQVYFTNQMSNFIDSPGKRMMGWNDIMGGNIHEWQDEKDVEVSQTLAQSAIIHFWKGNLELIEEAASKGHDIVNSHHWETYLDYDYERLPLSKAYAFDPIPEGLEDKYHSKILGPGCQMWSEWIPTVEKMQKQMYPRLAAYAEVGWTPKTEKNYVNFLKNLEVFKKRLDLMGVEYYNGTE